VVDVFLRRGFQLSRRTAARVGWLKRSTMAMERAVLPELLDHLLPADPRAMRSRRDLRRVNAMMRNAHIVAEALTRDSKPPPRSMIELGAGDGAWMVQLAAALPRRWSGVHALLLDRQDTVAAGSLSALAARGWATEVVTADVFDWLPGAGARADVIVANLFLHHFEYDRLQELLGMVASNCSLFVACEPRRSPMALHASRMLGLIGCNAVTRHDAVVSVRAGFADHEISAAWTAGEAWKVQECARGLFSHLFVAARSGETSRA
jgi:hypothetical protein